eukprot:SAG11_NODE_12973_length_676_cov_1.291161_1_plen_69_part_10
MIDLYTGREARDLYRYTQNLKFYYPKILLCSIRYSLNFRAAGQIDFDFKVPQELNFTQGHQQKTSVASR